MFYSQCCDKTICTDWKRPLRILTSCKLIYLHKDTSESDYKLTPVFVLFVPVLWSLFIWYLCPCTQSLKLIGVLIKLGCMRDGVNYWIVLDRLLWNLVGIIGNCKSSEYIFMWLEFKLFRVVFPWAVCCLGIWPPSLIGLVRI